MEKYKITLFQQNYRRDFPYYKSLSRVECEVIRRKLYAKLSLSNESQGSLVLVNALAKQQDFIQEANAEEEGFKLSECLKNLNITPPTHVYVNGYQFDEIDEMQFEDLNQYFSDIWFPGADDIDIFNNSLDWVLSIRHDGVLSLLKFI